MDGISYASYLCTRVLVWTLVTVVDFEIFIKLWKGSEIMRLDKAAAAARGFKLTYRVPPTQVYMSQATLAYQAALTFSLWEFRTTTPKTFVSRPSSSRHGWIIHANQESKIFHDRFKLPLGCMHTAA
jgi:hypothetical protein